MSIVGRLARLFGKDIRAAQPTLGKFGSLEHMRMLVGVTKIKRLQMSA